jgi:hypothetical protein
MAVFSSDVLVDNDLTTKKIDQVQRADSQRRTYTTDLTTAVNALSCGLEDQPGGPDQPSSYT